MHKVRLVVIGKIKEKYLQEAVQEYVKRLQTFTALEIIELKDQGKKKEAVLLEKYLTPNTFLLDEKGTEHTSIEFSKLIKKNEEITFIIGGAEGVEENIKKHCNTIALSQMTFIHEMCRVFLLEQIYRAHMILAGRKYHK